MTQTKDSCPRHQNDVRALALPPLTIESHVEFAHLYPIVAAQNVLQPDAQTFGVPCLFWTHHMAHATEVMTRVRATKFCLPAVYSCAQ